MNPVRTNAPGVLIVASDSPLAVEDLTAGEADALAALPGRARRRSWLTARRALRRALHACGRPADTSRYRFPDPVVSLSHSAELAVAAVRVGGPEAAIGVGVDIELDRAPDPRTAPFFLTETERSWLATVPETDRPASMLRLWTVKEALFKADPANAETTLRDYAVHVPRAHRGRATRTGAVQPPAPAFGYVSLAQPRGFISVAVALSPLWKGNPLQTADFDQVAKRVSSLISVPVERLDPTTTIAELVPDSFTFIEVAVDLQEEYDVVLAQDDLKELHTLGDLAELLRSRQAAPPPR